MAQDSSFVLALDSDAQDPSSQVTRGEAPLKINSSSNGNEHVLDGPDPIKNDSVGEEGNDDQLMQGLGQITAPIEMQNQIEQQIAKENKEIADAAAAGEESKGEEDIEQDEMQKKGLLGSHTPHEEEL